MSKKLQHVVKLLVFFGLLLSLLPTQDVARAQSPTVKKYTFPAMADQGTMNNVESSADGLKLVDKLSTLPFIWVAASGRGTAIKINTKTGDILAEYKTAPDNMQKNPSRTTVDLNGNAWVSNRNEGGGGKGSVTHFGLLENNQCVDRNGNGKIDTSTGLGDIKAWPSGDGDVTQAADECIIHYVRTSGTGVRHVSIDTKGDVWAGGWSNKKFDLIDGNTGQIKKSVGPFSCGGYGGLIDGNDVLWSAHSSNRILRYDTKTGDTKCITQNSYGLGLDSTGNIWAGPINSNIRKLDKDGTPIAITDKVNRFHRGVAVDSNDEVWIAVNNASNWPGPGSSVIRLDKDGKLLATITEDIGNGTTGVAVDAAGKIWITNYGSDNVQRIDPATNQVDKTISLEKGAAPYNYSDMTGSLVFANTSPQGTWTTVIDAGLNDTVWNKVTSSVAGGGNMELYVRVATTKAGLGGATQTKVTSGQNLTFKGRYMEVVAKLMPGADKSSPILKSIDVEYTNSNLSADDAPKLTAAGDTTWAFGGGAVIVDPDLLVTGGSTIDGARVSIGDNFKVDQDRLGIEGQGGNSGTIDGISWSYDSTKGLMTLSGKKSAAEYQTALRKVTYSNISNSPNDTARKVDFSLGSAIAYPGNGHFYEYIASKGIIWHDAKEIAEGKRLYGLQGYLGTMTSAGENSFVQDKVGGYAWIGGSDEETEGTWKWMTGPEAGQTFWQGLSNGSAVNGAFTAWLTGEPNNCCGNEDHLHFYQDKKWNDYVYNNGTISGYVVEYGGMTGDPTLQLTGQVTVNISNNQPPTNITLDKDTVQENMNPGTVVGIIKGVDPDDILLDYSLAEGEGSKDNGSFTLTCGIVLNRTSGTQCTLSTKAKFDYETQKELKILVRVVDKGGSRLDKIFPIKVINVDEDPVIKTIEPVVVDEGAPPTEKTVDISDPDGDVVSCTATSSNEGLVTVAITDCKKLTLTYVPGESGKSTITVNVTAGGKTTTKTFEVTVTKVINRAKAEEINKAVPTIKEDGSYAPINVDGLFIDGTDYAATSDNGTLVKASIDGTTKIMKLEVQPNQSGEARITITGKSGGKPAEYVVVAKVLPVNDKPTFTTLGNQKIAWSDKAQTVPGFAKDLNMGPNETDQAVDDFIVTVLSGKEFFETLPDVANDGTLTYKPSGAAGVAEVKISLRDNGGVANGGINESDPQKIIIEIPRVDQDLVVKNLNDDGPDSLRYVLRYIGPGRKVTFDPSLKDGTINLDSEICIEIDVTIDAESNNISLSGQSKNRVLCIGKAVNVTVKKVNIVDGFGKKQKKTTIEGESEFGGGGILVYNEKATLTLEDCNIANNKSEYTGGGIDGTGSSLIIRRCVIKDNQSVDSGGGIFWAGGDNVIKLTIEDSKLIKNIAGNRGGGLYSLYTVLEIIDSELLENKAKAGGGFYSDEYNDGSFKVIRSVLAKNEAKNWGGGFLGDIGTVINSTFSDNLAGGAGAFADAYSLTNDKPGIRLITVYGTTIYGNRASRATNSGGVSSYATKLEFKNSILAGNTRSGEAGSVEVKNFLKETSKAEFVSNGYNISDSDLSGVTKATGDMFNLNLKTQIKLASLGYYGGKTQSQPPLAGSKAVDNGDNATCEKEQENKDQMSNARPKKGNPAGNGACDIGAVEMQSAWPMVAEISPIDGTTGVKNGTPITVKFSEPVTVAKGGLVLACPQPMLITPDGGSGTDFTLTPTAGLPYGATCSVIAYADKITDKDSTIPGTGNLGGDYTSKFSTIPSVRIQVGHPDGAEFAGTEFYIFAIASGSVSSDQTVDLTVTGTGIDAGDYTLVGGKAQIVIPNGKIQGFVILKVTDDKIAEGTETANLAISVPAASTGIVLDTANSASINIADDDRAGLNVPASVGVIEGKNGTFKIKLKSQPTSPVTVALSPPIGTNRYGISTSVKIDSANWNTGADVLVDATGAFDNNDVGDSISSIVGLTLTSADPNYNISGQVQINIQDDDKVNVDLGIYSFDLTEGAAGGFPVKLTKVPTAGVTISVALSSDNPDRCTVSPAKVDLDVNNWNTGTTVEVIAVDNKIEDGDTICKIKSTVTSTDGSLNKTLDDVTVNVADNDVSGITVKKKDTKLATTEDSTDTETNNSFTIVLNSQPTSTVTIPLTSSDTTEGTLDKNSVTFDATNWNLPQTVIVTGVDDDETDGTINYYIIISPPAGYGKSTATLQDMIGGDAETFKPGTGDEYMVVWLSNEDNDSIGFDLGGKSTVKTSESGTNDEFTIKLYTKPFAPVTVQVVSSNAGEGIAEPSTLVFSSTNWNLLQTVKVMGVDDDFKDGTTPYTLTISVLESEDADYRNVEPRYIGGTNEDNDNPKITVAPTTLEVDEKGMTKTFTIVLGSRPSSFVEIKLESNNPKAGKVWPEALTFTPDNWNVPQEAVVTGLHDPSTIANVQFKIVTKIGLDVFDEDYNINPDDVNVTSKNYNIPVTKDDTALTTANITTTVDVLSNDTDLTETNEDGKAGLKLEGITGAPTNGKATVVNGMVLYDPALDFAGSDTFTYTVKDSDGNTAKGVVSVSVFPVTIAASGGPAFPIVGEGDSPNLIYPSNGSVTGPQPTFSWKPATSDAGIAYYEITLTPLPDGVTTPLTSTTTTYSPPFSLPVGEYVWTVRAYDRSGTEDNPVVSSPVLPQARFTTKATSGGAYYLPIIVKQTATQ